MSPRRPAPSRRQQACRRNANTEHTNMLTDTTAPDSAPYRTRPQWPAPAPAPTVRARASIHPPTNIVSPGITTLDPTSALQT
eukprot:2493880-Rhodomonas_salina.1